MSETKADLSPTPDHSSGSWSTMAGSRRRLLVATLVVAISAAVVIAAVVLRSSAHSGSQSRSTLSVTYAAPVGWRGLAFGGRWKRTQLTLETRSMVEIPAGSDRVWAGTDAGAWLSVDGGMRWQRVGLRASVVLAVAGRPDGREIAASDDSGNIFLAHVNGEAITWTRIASVPTDAIYCLAVSTDGHTILGGTYGAIYRGEEESGRWRWTVVARTGVAGVTSVTWLPWAPQRAVAAVFSHAPAVLATSDGGITWHPEVRGLPGMLTTHDLLPTQTPQRHVILTTMGNGMWDLSASGAWTQTGIGLPRHHAMGIVAGRRGTTAVYYAGSMGLGIFARQGAGTWRSFARGMRGGQYTTLGLVLVRRPNPSLLVATALGVYRYLPPGRT